ncbi:MAG: glycosyltransferase family 4 protein [Chitinophagales bacterium]
MRLLFAHDNVFLKAMDNTIYSKGYFRYEGWGRYLEAFDDVTVVARVQDLPCSEGEDGLTVSSGPGVYFKPIPTFSNPRDLVLNYFQARRMLKKCLRNYDALIARLPSQIGLLAGNLAMEEGIPWAVEVMGCTQDSLRFHGRWLARLYAPVAAFLARRLVARAGYAHFVTRDFLQKRYPCPGKVLACTDVKLPDIDPSLIIKLRVDRPSINRIPIKIGMIASLDVSYKGIDTALEALARAKDSIAPFQLHIVGPGQPERWQKMAQRLGLYKEVFLCGVLPGGEPLYEWLDTLDLYLQPSRTEGLPRSLLEAMSRGCPALASNVGGVSELLPADCLFHAGDSKELSRLLIKYTSDEDWQKKQTLNNIKISGLYSERVVEPAIRNFWREFAIHAERSPLNRGRRG